mmetsp:Transcript_26644/g.83394  ORF Transcript_26644/g.83394 Transcript_26644/m.83394 type:complete len:276 (-) Transcript_26644:756-1583(-)
MSTWVAPVVGDIVRIRGIIGRDSALNGYRGRVTRRSAHYVGMLLLGDGPSALFPELQYSSATGLQMQHMVIEEARDRQTAAAAAEAAAAEGRWIDAKEAIDEMFMNANGETTLDDVALELRVRIGYARHLGEEGRLTKTAYMRAKEALLRAAPLIGVAAVPGYAGVMLPLTTQYTQCVAGDGAEPRALKEAVMAWTGLLFTLAKNGDNSSAVHCDVPYDAVYDLCGRLLEGGAPREARACAEVLLELDPEMSGSSKPPPNPSPRLPTLILSPTQP